MKLPRRRRRRCVAHGLHRGRVCPTCWTLTTRQPAVRVAVSREKHDA